MNFVLVVLERCGRDAEVDTLYESSYGWGLLCLHNV